MKLLVNLFVLLLFLPFESESQTHVSGKLLSRDTQTIQDAHIQVSPWLESDLFEGKKIIRVNSDGTFRFNISKPGLYQLRFSAPMHSRVSVPLLVALDPGEVR